MRYHCRDCRVLLGEVRLMECPGKSEPITAAAGGGAADNRPTLTSIQAAVDDLRQAIEEIHSRLGGRWGADQPDAENLRAAAAMVERPLPPVYDRAAIDAAKRAGRSPSSDPFPPHDRDFNTGTCRRCGATQIEVEDAVVPLECRGPEVTRQLVETDRLKREHDLVDQLQGLIRRVAPGLSAAVVAAWPSREGDDVAGRLRIACEVLAQMIAYHERASRARQ